MPRIDPSLVPVVTDLDRGLRELGIPFGIVGALVPELLLNARPRRMTNDADATVIIDNLADFNTLKDRLSAYGFTRTRVPHRMQHRDGGLLDLLPFSATMAPNGRRQLEDGVIFNMAGFSHVVPNAISTLYLSSLRGSQRARTSRLTSSQLKRTKRWNSPSSRRSWSPCMPKPRDWSSRSTPAPMPMHCTPLARSGHMSVA